MRAPVWWAARLYPAAWRARYGREFETLLEDVGPNWRDLWNILQGALVMQISTFNFWKATAMLSAGGALLASVIAFSTPRVYDSTSVARVRGAGGILEIAKQLEDLRTEVLSRANLGEIIARENLYPQMRDSTLNRAIAQMQRDLKIIPLDTRPDSTAFMVKFSYANPAAAQKAVTQIMSRLIEANLKPRPEATVLEILDPASYPPRPSRPNWWAIIFAGVMVGCLSGLVFFGRRYSAGGR